MPERISVTHNRKILTTVAVGGALAAVALLPVLSSTADSADASTEISAQAVAGSDPAYAVEDFAYPGAEEILATKGIQLLRGDGHITLADCSNTEPQIKVLTVADSSANRAGTYCFKATGTSGFLTLELPRVFGLETADHPISADLTASGVTSTVELDEDDYQSVGEGTVGGDRSVLVEIRVTG
jgi:hypothetical protein